MHKALRDSRIGVYESEIADDGSVWKGNYVCGNYIGVFNRDYLLSEIIPDLRQKKQAGWPFNYPLLIATWSLQQGDPPKPLPMPGSSAKLNMRRTGVLNVRRMLGLPIRRKKNPRTEIWQAVVDESGRARRVTAGRIERSS